jgi:hypothetical protein
MAVHAFQVHAFQVHAFQVHAFQVHDQTFQGHSSLPPTLQECQALASAMLIHSSAAFSWDRALAALEPTRLRQPAKALASAPECQRATTCSMACTCIKLGYSRLVVSGIEGCGVQ